MLAFSDPPVTPAAAPAAASRRGDRGGSTGGERGARGGVGGAAPFPLPVGDNSAASRDELPKGFVEPPEVIVVNALGRRGGVGGG